MRQRIDKPTAFTARIRPERQTAVASTPTRVMGEDQKLTDEGHRQNVKQPNLLQLQQQFGNRHVMRVLADPSRLQLKPALIQREDKNSPANPELNPNKAAAAKPPMKEVTVPIPAEHPAKAASAKAAAEGEAPTAPEQAKIRIPLELDFQLLPPELKLRLFNDLNLTAAVTEANLALKHDRLKLGLGYEYGGEVTGEGSYRAGVGTFSSKFGYNPSSSASRFDVGFERDKWRAGAYATSGKEYGASLSYGMAPLPNLDEVGTAVRAGEQGARNVVTDLPAVADPTKLPKTIEKHKDDFSAIGSAVGPIVDLAKRDPSHIDWGFYLRFTKGPYTPSEFYAPYYQGFQGQDEYKVTAGAVARF